MTKIKRKLLAGILGGALILGGGMMNLVQAEPVANEQQSDRQRHERPQMTEEQIDEYAQQLAEYYGVNQAEIATALRNRVHFEDIKIAAKLAKLSGKSFSEVLAMKVDWQQVAEQLGITHEQIEESMKADMLEGLAKRSKLDTKTVENLLKENYDPHDITVAGIIANASGKNVKNVFSKRKINNSWDDVAKEFGVDLKSLMRPNHDRDKKEPRQ